MHLYEQIARFVPHCAQEKSDRITFLRAIQDFGDVLLRSNSLAHVTASSWILNPQHTHVLMVYHNLYNSWSWTGGHADGDDNLLRVAMREAQEETSLASIRALSNEIFSMEVLHVTGHIKHGNYVGSHLHLNVTYLLEADDAQSICNKPDENSAVRWFKLDEALKACSEPYMLPIYQKLNLRAAEFFCVDKA